MVGPGTYNPKFGLEKTGIPSYSFGYKDNSKILGFREKARELNLGDISDERKLYERGTKKKKGKKIENSINKQERRS